MTVVCPEGCVEHQQAWFAGCVDPEEALDRFWHPWKYPDRPQVRSVDLFPRVTAARRRAAAVVNRVAGAWTVLRHGWPE